MRNICLVIAYDGGAFAGWQIQPDRPTVQGTIERVLQRMTQQPCRLRAAGRTDAGVHAEGQLANFRTESTIACHRFLRGLNALLPDEITIRRVDEVAPDFDARRHNQGKHYRYTIWNDAQIPPPQRRFCHHLYGTLDLPAMARAARRLVGTHDFAAFRAADCDRQSTRRTLFRCSVTRKQARVQVDVEGTAFLKNMVRIIAGTLIAIGQGRSALSLIDRLLRDGDRRAAGATAPAHGLCLVQVIVD